MFHKVIEQDLLLVDLEQAKRQVGLTSAQTFHDVYLKELINVATEFVAKACPSKMLSKGTVTVEWDNNRDDGMILFGGEISEITEVKVDGVVTTDYTFRPISQILTVEKVGKIYEATYEAGPDEPPKLAQQAALLLVEDLFENRSQVITGASVADAPVTVQRLLNLLDPTVQGNS